MNISNNSIYAVITVNPTKILKKINTGLSKQSDSLWKFKSDYIINIFKKNNINPSNFAPLGHLWFNTAKLPQETSFILINNNNIYSKYPVGYKKILKYGTGYIWKPIPPKGYISVGFIYSTTKPSTKSVKTVRSNIVHINNKKTKNVSQNTSMNKYHYLGNVLHKKYCINTNIHNNGNVSNKKNYNWNNDEESVDSWITTMGKYVKLTNHHEPWYVKNNISKHHVHTSKPKEEPIIIKEKTELSKSNTNRIILYLVIFLFIIFMIRFMINMSSK